MNHLKLSPMLTDFYQFSMAYGYWQLGMHQHPAVFHLSFRRNPIESSYVILSGLEMMIDFLRDFRFSDDDIEYLRTVKTTENKPYFSEDFLIYLKTLRFTGDIDTVSEGTILFAHEPVLRITASLLQCQLLETVLINIFNFSSLVTTLASQFRTVVDHDILFEFGLRRAQGPNGGVTASRAAYIGGFDATSNVLAGQRFHIPVVGTMSHSWVMAFDDEYLAFQAYANVMSNNVILLVDTYETQSGLDHAIQVGNALKKQGHLLKGIRLDSGELAILSQLARQKLDAAGFSETKIYASGDLTLKKVKELKALRAPIDGWGVGTYLSTSADQPSMDMVYKLGAIKKDQDWHYHCKRSDNPKKSSDPGILQTRRFYHDERWLEDMIYHVDFGFTHHLLTANREQDLLLPIFRSGNLVYASPNLSSTRNYVASQVKQFHLSEHAVYPVKKDEKLLALKKELLEYKK